MNQPDGFSCRIKEVSDGNPVREVCYWWPQMDGAVQYSVESFCGSWSLVTLAEIVSEMHSADWDEQESCAGGELTDEIRAFAEAAAKLVEAKVKYFDRMQLT